MKAVMKTGLVILGCLLLVHSAWSAEQSRVLRLFESVRSAAAGQQIRLPASCDRTMDRIRAYMDENGLEKGRRSIVHRLDKASANLTVEVITQDWNGTEWVNETKDIFTYDDNMTEVFSLVSQEWDGAAWVNSGRMTTKQDGSGNITEMGFDTWRNGQWMTDMLTLYTYDAQGNMTSMVIKMDMYGTGVLENFSKTEYVYNAGGQLTQETNYLWNYGDWTKLIVTDYIYNAQGQLTEERDKMDLYGIIMEQGRTVYTYHANGEVETETEQTYQLATQTYENSARTLYEYNGDKQITSEVDQIWDGAQWVNETRWVTTFGGPDGQVTEELYQEWQDGAWVNVDRTVYSYDGSGNDTESLDQVWENGAWVNESRYQSEYNQDGLPTVTVTQVWENGQWVNDSRALFTYSGGSAVLTEETSHPSSFILSNYPNPFNPVTTIVFTLPEKDNVTLRILDVRGRTVRTLMVSEQLPAGSGEIQWNGLDDSGKSLPSGVYLYRLTGSRVSAVGRCLLSR